MTAAPRAVAVSGSQRIAALAALVLGALFVVSLIFHLITEFPGGLLAPAAFVLALAAAVFAIGRRGAWRIAGFATAVLLLIVAAAIPIVRGNVLVGLAGIACLLLTLAAVRAAFSIHVHLPAADPPKRPVLLMNPHSGGGKVVKFDLEARSRKLGIEPVLLGPGDDLRALAEAAVARGADALGMAGGDGSQAIVADVASAHGLPFICIPAGTRNHFALDLGVDRDDVPGALAAFTDGGERRVDLAEVNGRVFVNNASMGLYAQAVEQEGYRDAKLRTMLDVAPDVLGPDGTPPDLRWTSEGGHEHATAAVILVSNNRYLLGQPVGSGTRPRMDEAQLGIAIVAEQGARKSHPWREWSAQEFEVRSDGPVPVGVDGETLQLDPPLRFKIRPGVLRVRIASAHPGASPSAAQPQSLQGAVSQLAHIAAGGGLTH